MFTLLVILFFSQNACAVIYSLNESQYALMPPVVHLDPYERCKLDTDARYCTADFALVSNVPSPLLDMIKEYSEHRTTHYNHTKLRYGICVTQTCKKFYKNETGDLNWTLVACLNEWLTNNYKLEGNELEEYNCHHPGKSMKDIDYLDIIVGIIVLTFLVLNIVGSLNDVFAARNKKASRYLEFFSISRNWNKLVTSDAEGRNPRLQRLKSFDGMRSIMMSLVIVGHTQISAFAVPDNPKFIEEIYKSKAYYAMTNGALIMQTFFMISAFLLVYLWLLESDNNHRGPWSMLQKRILKRWLRLTPSYAFIIALTATWFAHLTSGPLWNKCVAADMNACRQNWWQHILYINNFNNSNCLAQAWYLAADTQLYILAVIIFLVCRTTRSRIITLSILFLAGMIIPAMIVYLQDLDGVVLLSPEVLYNIFIRDDHFNKVYSQSYCNLPGFVVGIGIAYLVHHWQNEGLDFKKYQTWWYRVLYWSIFPLLILCCCSGSIFYYEAPRQSIFISAAYAAFSKPIFSILVGTITIGFIFKFEGVYRGVLEWRGWTVINKLTYSAYLLHVSILKNIIAAERQTVHVGTLYIVGNCLTILVMTLVATFFFWLLVEAPLANIVEKCLLKSKQKIKDDMIASIHVLHGVK